jgi:GAF domain-containing protein
MNKSAKYRELLAFTGALTASNTNLNARLEGFCKKFEALFGKWWQGFYVVDSQSQYLILGPNIGPPACEKIAFGKGVCGTAWKENRTLIVPDVHLFEGHIACSSASNSEIVVPVFDILGTVVAVFDVDSVQFDDFDAEDQAFLEEACKLIGDAWNA